MELIDKIKSKDAKIGVIGLGYVGLPLVMEFCKAGFQVTGFDIDDKKVSLLKQGKSYIKHIDSHLISQYIKLAISSKPNKLDKPKEPNELNERFIPTSDFSKLSDIDCVIICVPTPLNKNREPDMSFVFNTAKTIAQYLRKGQLIILESTTYPGTTDEDMRFILEETGLKAGEDFYLAFSPEREDPNRKDFSTSTIPKIVSGYTEKCLAVTNALMIQLLSKQY